MRKTWRSTSASQIKTFKSCKRKWFRESVLGERQPPSKGALRGQAIHKELENYLLHGTPCQDGTALALCDLLPEGGSQTPFNVEVEFNWTPEGFPVPIRGFIDLALDENNEIIDHKSTSSLNYALSEITARRDPQALIYCGVALAGELGLDFYKDDIKFTLNYGTTKGITKTSVVSISLSREEVKEGLKDLSLLVHEQSKLSQSESWEDVNPNFSTCDNFGGCAFKSDCMTKNRPVLNEVLTLATNNNIDSFKEALARRKAQMNIDKVDPEGLQYQNVNPPDGLPDGEDPEIKQKKKRLTWKGQALSSLKAQNLKDAITELGHEPLKTMKENKALLLELLEDPSKQKKESTPMQTSFFDLATNAQEPVKPPAPIEPETTEPPPVPVKPQPTEQPPAPSEEVEALPSLEGPKMVLVDCIAPNAVEIERCLSPMISHIESKYNMPISTIKYAEGWKELAGLISAHGWEGSNLANIILVSSDSPLWSHCSHVIIPLSNVVIRGIR